MVSHFWRVSVGTSCRLSGRDTKWVSPLRPRKSRTTPFERNGETIRALSRRAPKGVIARPLSPPTQKRHLLSSKPSGHVKRTRLSLSYSSECYEEAGECGVSR